jgi:hypothetical protein
MNFCFGEGQVAVVKLASLISPRLVIRVACTVRQCRTLVRSTLSLPPSSTPLPFPTGRQSGHMRGQIWDLTAQGQSQPRSRHLRVLI